MRATTVREFHPPLPRLEATSALAEVFDRALGVGKGENNLTNGERATGQIWGQK